MDEVFSDSEQIQQRQAKKNQCIYEEQISLLLLEAREQFGAALQRALPRIRYTIRGSDLVFFQEKTCAVVLPATPITGAQVVARRLATVLVDVEFTTHVLYGAAAQTALAHFHVTRAIEIPVESFSSGNDRGSTVTPCDEIELFTGGSGLATLPHLAYLTQYPPLRLFQLFPYELASRYRCVPVGAERGVLTVATSQHLDATATTQMQAATRRTIFQVYCQMSIIEDVLRYWERMLPAMVGTRIVS